MKNYGYLGQLINNFYSIDPSPANISKKQLKRMSVMEKLAVILKFYDAAFSNLIKEGDVSKKFAIQECGMVALFLGDYLKGEAEVYKIASGFGQHLRRTKLDVPTSALSLPMGKSWLFDFPEDISFPGKNGEIYRSALVVSGAAFDNTKTIQILSPDDESAKTTTMGIMDICSKGTIDESIDFFEKEIGKMLFPRDFVQYVAKCLLYVESGEPDLQRVAVEQKTKNPKKLRLCSEFDYPFNFVRVGYGFHGRTYRVDETQVRGHFRWQPYGPDLSKVKLIWIDEHIRKFDREQKADNSDHANNSV